MQEAFFTFDWVKKHSHNRLHGQRNLRRRRLMDDGHPHRHSTTARHQIPAFHSHGAASLSIGSISLRGKPNITLEILIHTNSRLTAAPASKFVCSFDAERRVHLLLIVDRLTSAPVLFPSSALSARSVDAPDRSEIASTAFRFLQQVDVDTASGELFKPPWWESRSPSWLISVSK